MLAPAIGLSYGQVVKLVFPCAETMSETGPLFTWFLVSRRNPVRRREEMKKAGP
jgi:Na+/H+ antiporter NhaB